MRVIGISYTYLRWGIRSFANFVPKTVVQRIVKGDKRATHLYVDKAEVTIFFSGINNFASIKEAIGLEQVMLMMEEYLTFISHVIEEEGGVIGDFIDDGIMAFWGSPHPTPLHADLACKVALRVQSELYQWNKTWQKKYNMPEVITRIGLSSGVVLAGNIGSEEKMKFGILGDEVNLAARINGLNKRYLTSILISSATYDRVSKSYLCRALELVAVKGRTGGTTIYELMETMERASDRQRAMARDAELIMEYYCKREWKNALQVLKVAEAEESQDPALRHIRNLCEELDQIPPPDDWDPVVKINEKY